MPFIKKKEFTKKHKNICQRCVMDTSDSGIIFNENGFCDNCVGFYQDVLPFWFPNEDGQKLVEKKVDEIKSCGAGNKYDCILGLSGGLDSSYLLHVVVNKYGLRPLVFHVDGGWNTEVAVSNIQSLVDKMGLDLFVEVIEWDEMRDFQLALFKSGTPYLDIAQDHAFIATLYHYARKHKIKYILNGGNYATECIRHPKDVFYYGTDMALIKDVCQRFGTRKMLTYPWSNVFYHKLYLRCFVGVEVVKFLNSLPFVKETAILELSKIYGWRPYPQKHFESRFTKYFEGYWLPTRFNYDVRRAQYSSLIVTGQMTRAEALVKLQNPPLPPETIAEENEYIANKLEISIEELDGYLKMEKKTFRDYKNNNIIFEIGARVLKMLGQERNKRR